jgi:ribosomal protein S18 acetylase RimI-like enzyme
MSLSIRYATKDDAALIADVSQKTFYDTFAADNTPEDMEIFLSEQFTKGRLMLEVGSPGNEFLLAYKNNAVAGYVKLREGKVPLKLKGKNLLEIARLYVLKEFIGERVGAQLMQRSIDIAREKNKEAIWLGVWEKNQRAIDFYRKFGFEKFSECDFLLGKDLQRDWMMKKEL